MAAVLVAASAPKSASVLCLKALWRTPAGYTLKPVASSSSPCRQRFLLAFRLAFFLVFRLAVFFFVFFFAAAFFL